MRLTYFCYISAALAGVTGMSLGLYMGIAEDHSLAPAHAHLNLLGWVTMMLYGLYHRGAPQWNQAARWTQVGLGGAGFPAFSLGLAFYLQTGSEAVFPVVIAGILSCILSMVLFAAILMRDAWSQAPSYDDPAHATRPARPLPNLQT